MGLLFKDDLLDEFGLWPIAYIPYGGADFGEIAAVAKAVGDGDGSAFHQAWAAAGDRFAAEADAAERRGGNASARELFLRASVFYSTSLRPLFGTPVDPRLLATYRKEVDAFDKGLALTDPPIRPRAIPFEGASMPAYFIPAKGTAGARRPTIIFTNGYDGTLTDMFFASAVAAGRRGYHSLLFDGPGQGGMLFEQNIPLRPDWETVIKAVVDFALAIPQVDPQKIILSGWSLGGYFAPRAASGEPRLAACVADPGQWAVLDSIRATAIRMGLPPAAAADLGSIDEATAAVVRGRHHGECGAALEGRPARLLGERRQQPARLFQGDRALHDEGPGGDDPLSDAADGGGERSARHRRSDPVRRAEMSEGADKVHRRRGRRRPLRDDEQVVGEPDGPRLAR